MTRNKGIEINPVRFVINSLGKQSKFDPCVQNKCFLKLKKCKGFK